MNEMKSTSHCGLLIKQINDGLSRDSNNELRRNGLTLSQIRYMEYLYAHSDEPVLFKKLEAYFNVSQPTNTGILKRMQEKDLVRISMSKDGGKAKTAVLTEKGRKKYEDSEVRRSSAENNLLKPLRREEKKSLEDMLQRVLDNQKRSS